MTWIQLQADFLYFFFCFLPAIFFCLEKLLAPISCPIRIPLGPWTVQYLLHKEDHAAGMDSKVGQCLHTLIGHIGRTSTLYVRSNPTSLLAN